MDVMTAGRMGVFADPVGAAFRVWQAGEHRGAGVVNEPGTFSWSELITTDVPRLEGVLRRGVRVGRRHHGRRAGVYTEWQVDGRSIGGMMEKPPQMPAEVPPFWAVYFNVVDTDDAVAADHRARRCGDQPADGHRARPLRGGRRPHRRRLQRHRHQSRDGRGARVALT